MSDKVLEASKKREAQMPSRILAKSLEPKPKKTRKPKPE
jgi:hypothetical protein